MPANGPRLETQLWRIEPGQNGEATGSVGRPAASQRRWPSRTFRGSTVRRDGRRSGTGTRSGPPIASPAAPPRANSDR